MVSSFLFPPQTNHSWPNLESFQANIAGSWGCSSSMELGRNLQTLVERAWVLHDGLSEEIEKINSSFCRFCSKHGRYCNIVETPFQEKEGLISIKDSLKERLRSWQPIDRQESLTRLEESRLTLMEKIAQYRGRPLGVVEELNACFSSGETAFHRKLSELKKIKGFCYQFYESRCCLASGGSTAALKVL
ncbi:hypothetical protein D5086_005044 [Populus alba]|uniref:Uncharacterized protein n=1 Tax=Populus alba TaxID=43335 RepID=A0ACC4CS86_POPAL